MYCTPARRDRHRCTLVAHHAGLPLTVLAPVWSRFSAGEVLRLVRRSGCRSVQPIDSVRLMRYESVRSSRARPRGSPSFYWTRNAQCLRIFATTRNASRRARSCSCCFTFTKTMRRVAHAITRRSRRAFGPPTDRHFGGNVIELRRLDADERDLFRGFLFAGGFTLTASRSPPAACQPRRVRPTCYKSCACRYSRYRGGALRLHVRSQYAAQRLVQSGEALKLHVVFDWYGSRESLTQTRVSRLR